MSARQTIFIDAPVEKVFDWFRNPRNWVRLDPGAASSEELTEVHVTSEGLGTFHVWAMKPLPGIRFECFAVCTEFVPNRLIVDTWSLSLYGTYAYTFEPDGSGTRVTLQRHPRSFWRLRFLDKLMDHFENRSNEKFLGRVKLFLESAGAPAKAG